LARKAAAHCGLVMKMGGTTPSGSCSIQAMLLAQIESPALERLHGRSEEI